ncbi:MAG: hypothetical protein JO336_01310 [Acidobacteriia bacterium]|nr:hypothetical protein [Terriglobia bacterium]
MSKKAKPSRRSVPMREAIAAEILTLAPEEHELYERFCEEIIESLDPQGPLEFELARTIAVCQWQQKRIFAYETALLAEGPENGDSVTGQPEIDQAFRGAQVFFANLKALNTLSIFEERILKMHSGTLKRLQQVQSERQTREQARIDKAVSMYRVFKANGKAFDPQCHGFVFSSGQIEMEARRRELLERARQ